VESSKPGSKSKPAIKNAQDIKFMNKFFYYYYNPADTPIGDNFTKQGCTIQTIKPLEPD
jgi:hypothetical protein